MNSTDFSANLRGRWKAAISGYDPIRVGGRIVSSRGLMLTCKLAAAVKRHYKRLRSQQLPPKLY